MKLATHFHHASEHCSKRVQGQRSKNQGHVNAVMATAYVHIDAVVSTLSCLGIDTLVILFYQSIGIMCNHVSKLQGTSVPVEFWFLSFLAIAIHS